MEKPTVRTPSPRMAALAQKRDLINDLMGGTFRMRAAGVKWLPQHPAESDGVYTTRLQKTFLDNFLELAISKGTGKIFKKPIALEKAPSQIEDILCNIDLQGSGLDAFAQQIGNRSLEAGITYVLVDMPPAGDVKTAAEEKAAGIRPYVAHIDPDNVIEILTGMVGGSEVIQRVRILECSQVNDGEWGYAKVEQVRVLEMRDGVMCFDVYREVEDQTSKKKIWVIQPDLSGATTFPAIFLVPFYSNRTAFMEGEPGFQNIAESTLEHWQWKSEHAHALSMCCFGMYTATGVEQDFKMAVGPAKCLVSTSPDAEFGVVETTGKGVELAEHTLSAIESRIETAGVQLRVENAGQVTATAAALDSAETNAGLVAVAHGFEDSWETVFAYMQTILNLEAAEVEVGICTDLGGVKGTQAGLTELGKARALGDLSRESYLEALVWRGELPEDFDIAENCEQCDNEGPALGTMDKKTEDQAKCPSCGAMNPAGSKTCSECKEPM